MEFHLVTGSKGGAGKTLLSLMMLARSLDKQRTGEGEYTLIVDLNNMNVDFSRLLLKTGNGRPHDHTKAGADVVLAGKNFGFSLVTGFNDKKFVVAQPRNPFETHTHKEFEKFILSLNLRASNKKLVSGETTEVNWMKELFGRYGIQGGSISRIIIDTNYHFATLFPMNKALICKEFKLINIKIWFLWVYAQVEAIFPALGLEVIDHEESENEEFNESRVVLDTSRAIESTFNNTPFRHVISTIAMLPLEKDKERRKNVFEALKNVTINLARFGFNDKRSSLNINPQQDGKEVIQGIKDVITATAINNTSFRDWIVSLNTQFERIGTTDIYTDTHLRFAEMIVGCFPQGTRIKNVYPFATYDPKLDSYTDKNNEDLNCGSYLLDLKSLDIYTEFTTMLNKSGDFQ